MGTRFRGPLGNTDEVLAISFENQSPSTPVENLEVRFLFKKILVLLVLNTLLELEKHFVFFLANFSWLICIYPIPRKAVRKRTEKRFCPRWGLAFGFVYHQNCKTSKEECSFLTRVFQKMKKGLLPNHFCFSKTSKAIFQLPCIVFAKNITISKKKSFIFNQGCKQMCRNNPECRSITYVEELSRKTYRYDRRGRARVYLEGFSNPTQCMVNYVPITGTPTKRHPPNIRGRFYKYERMCTGTINMIKFYTLWLKNLCMLADYNNIARCAI